MEGKDFAKTALMGAAVGALAGVLLAPKSGKETRQDIKDRFEEIKDAIAVKIGELEDFTKKNYEQIVGSVVSSYQTAKKITPEEADEIRKILEESFDKIQESLERSGKEAAKELEAANKK